MTGFQKGIRIATIAEIPIYLHVSWFVIFGLVAWSLSHGYFPARYPDLPVATYWAKGLVASLLLFASVLAHELGHSLVARRHDIDIASITLFIFGGLASLEEDPRSPGAEFQVAIAGPLTSLVVAGLFAGVAAVVPPASPGAAVAGYVAFLNVVLAAFNLVPALPLDGGRVLRAVLWKVWGRARGTRVAAGAGTGFAYLLIAYGIFGLFVGAGLGGVWAILIGWFVKEASTAAGRQGQLQEVFADVRVGDVMVPDCRTVPAEATIDRVIREHFMRYGYGGFPVVREGELIGLLSLVDVSKIPRESRTEVTAESAMTPLEEETVVEADADILAALRKMSELDSGRLLVRDAGRCVGMVTHSDIVKRWQVARALGGE
jgi:Zn-dependent protease/predicted transcriptional regulator